MVTALALLVGGVALVVAILRLRQRPPRTSIVLVSIAIAVWLLVTIVAVAAGITAITQTGTPDVVLEPS
ncbi:hypothetical protein ROT00_16830 [Agromyces mediolanus]|uniref:hypothetical protein n=1 Tax=Agromyces mediolanus TaxID=41986 RepID=UPI0038394F24